MVKGLGRNCPESATLFKVAVMLIPAACTASQTPLVLGTSLQFPEDEKRPDEVDVAKVVPPKALTILRFAASNDSTNSTGTPETCTCI